ncbi:MAG TPA: ATP-binding protein [Opitutus sp.]|nr:ATP-binding protein [Opitutus sp.]
MTPDRSARTSRPPFPEPGRLRLLLLEDDPAFQLLVRTELEDDPTLETEVVTVDRLADGLRRLAGGGFDVVLTDLNLPDSTGIPTFARLAAAAPDIPLIVFTNLPDEAVAAQILRRGAQDYVLKSRLAVGVLGRILRHAIERHGHARELAESEARVRAIYDASIDAIVVTDADGIVRFANPAAGGMFGRTPEKLVGDHFGFPVVAGALTEVDILRPDGSVGVAEMHVVDLPWNGAPAHLASLRDITERKRAEVDRRRMETQLRQANKLEAIGQLAAGIAHEINTPAHFVGHNLEFAQLAFTRLAGLLAQAQTDGFTAEIGRSVGALLRDIPPAIADARTGIERVAKIVLAMKEFSHPGTPGGEQPEPTDLNHTIENAIVVAQHEWKLVADMAVHLDPTLPPVPLFPGEFNQVLLNLLVNAAHAVAAAPRDAGAGKGVITVTTRRNGDHAAVLIRDTGAGIPAAIRHRVFEPFFTTKGVGEGTGQGLAHAHAIITKRHGGDITFESESGRGTCFVIRLPLAPAAVAG